MHKKLFLLLPQFLLGMLLILAVTNKVHAADSRFHFEEKTVTGYTDQPVYLDLVSDPTLDIEIYYWEPFPGREKQTSVPQLTYTYDDPGIFTLYVTARDKNGNFHVAETTVNIQESGAVAGLTTPTEITKVDRALIGIDDIFDFAKTYPFLFAGMVILLGYIISPLFKRNRKNIEPSESDQTAYQNLMNLATGTPAINYNNQRNLVIPRRYSPSIPTPPLYPES